MEQPIHTRRVLPALLVRTVKTFSEQRENAGIYHHCVFPCAIEALAYNLHASGKLQNDVHYGNPKGGCLPDERIVTIQGVGGDLCSPDMPSECIRPLSIRLASRCHSNLKANCNIRMGPKVAF